MSKKNYNKISTEKINAEATEVVVEETVAEVEPEVASPVVATVIGVVSECARLNVRKNPNIKSDVVCVIPKGAEVVIDESKSTNAFYYVCVSNIIEKTQFEGYCMKKYISIKR